MNIETIRAELRNGESWKNREVEAFYAWWVDQPYYIQEKKRRVPTSFIDAAKILGELTDEEIMEYWVRWMIERGEET